MKRKDSVAYLYLSPALIGLVLFTIIPVVATLYLSFTHYKFSGSSTFVGLTNYNALFSSALFRQVIVQSFWYVVLYVPLCVAAAMGLALLVHSSLRGVGFFRTVFFLPVVTSTVAVAIMWSWLYNSDIGLLRYLLHLVGLTSPRWLEDPAWAMPAIALMSVWKTAGYTMMILLAALANVPVDQLDAAKLDGASAPRRFWRVTMPSISPALFFVTIITTISAFQIFEQTYVLTKGGPANSTLTLSYYVWQMAFEFFQLGRASAAGYVLFFIVAIISLLQFWLRKRWVFEA